MVVDVHERTSHFTSLLRFAECHPLRPCADKEGKGLGPTKIRIHSQCTRWRYMSPMQRAGRTHPQPPFFCTRSLDQVTKSVPEARQAIIILPLGVTGGTSNCGQA